jgi:hypothetical protein
MQRHASARSQTAVEEELLPRHGEGDSDLQSELLLLEMSLLRSFRAHERTVATKTKIVAALKARG